MTTRSKGGNKVVNTEELEYVTMETVKEMLDNQKEQYETLLGRQEKVFSNFCQMILDSTIKRVDSLVGEIQEFKVSLNYSQKDIDDLKKQAQMQKADFNGINKLIQDLKSELSLKSCDEQLDYIENQSRRNNIVITGLGPDRAEETWEQTEDKVKELITKNLKVEAPVEIERAHRNGKFRAENDRPRSIIVKLLRFKDKQLIMARARSLLKNTSIYINEDFSERVRKRRAELLPALKEARARGDYAVISYDRLVVKPKMRD
ncbi:unnamed protein product [Knipowitschia caucasica]